MRLENWTFGPHPDVDCYTPPELITYCVWGDIYGHPGYTDGSPMRTSSPIGWDHNTGCMITNTGSRYELGSPRSDYEERFPDARNRMVERLKQLKGSIGANTV